MHSHSKVIQKLFMLACSLSPFIATFSNLQEIERFSKSKQGIERGEKKTRIKTNQIIKVILPQRNPTKY